MYITKFQVLNFKSYRDSSEIEFKPGFNIITGQNSSGKTALLDAMTLLFTNSPHRSLRTVPEPGRLPSQECVVRVTLSLTRNELFGLPLPGSFLLPQPPEGFPIPGNSPYQVRPDEAAAFLRWLSEQPDYSISLSLRKWNGGEDWTAEGLPLGRYPAATPDPNGRIGMLTVTLLPNRELRFHGFDRNPSTKYLATDVAGWLRTRIYRFWAERFNIGQSAFGNNSMLAPNAQNLPEAIDTLTANPQRFSQLNELVREVLPQVKQVSVQTLPNNQVQIIVWSHDPATQRVDLAIPLNDCGSGVGQVLAILYVVLTSDHSQVILVDEPQSFLHPGAVRKLIEVLKRYPQHQYIFATHSPAVITAAEPTTLTIVRATDAETSLRAIDPLSAKDLQTYLTEIGARLSDVFGADSILWVEGQTEEACFPRILKIVGNRPLRGTAIVGIRQTGDMTGRDKKKILEMYRRLSAANTLLPPALAFVLDKECLADRQLDDVIRAGRDGEGQDLVHFLPRRMYENYILRADAIAEVANSAAGFRSQQVHPDEVQQLLDRKQEDRQYYCPRLQVIPPDRLSHVDGARILKEIFGELSEERVPYDKVRHSTAITEWILAHNPEEFTDLSDWLLTLFP